ncbi:MAG: RluA family pseudouridine synthase [Pseudomonadota bacterium]
MGETQLTQSAHIAPPYTPPAADRLQIVHADGDCIVANKPSGLLSVPGLGPEKAFCAQSILKDQFGEAHTVHRLDMDTSGLIIFARTKDAQRHLSHQFQQRRVAKTYEAIVSGVVAEASGVIDLPIAKYSLQRPLRHIDPDGQFALTRWQVIARGLTATRLCLIPETGRSHQLRLHLKSIGHPVLGDAFYGDKARSNRLLLHAKALSFQPPSTIDKLTFQAAPDF